MHGFRVWLYLRVDIWMYESVYGIAHACMYIFMYVCMRACRQVCVSTYTDTYTYQYLYMYQIRWCIYCGRHNLDEPRSKLDTHGASFSCAAFRARSMRPFATTLPHRESLRLSSASAGGLDKEPRCFCGPSAIRA